MNQGKGIYLISSKEQLLEKLNMNGGDDSSARRSHVRPPQGRVIQRYTVKPQSLGFDACRLIFYTKIEENQFSLVLVCRQDTRNKAGDERSKALGQIVRRLISANSWLKVNLGF